MIASRGAFARPTAQCGLPMTLRGTIISTALALCTIATHAYSFAVFMDGNALLRSCSAPRGDIYQGECLGYIQGVVDAGSANSRICPSVNIELQQLVDIVIRYLKAHPENRHLAAAQLVEIAVRSFFSCADADK
jgi:Rap1a immunity proteins